MAILSISRDWGVDPSIVRVTTDDNLTTITTAGYLTAQAAKINALNFGAFEWKAGDLVAIYYSNGENYFTRDATNNTFVLDVTPPGALALTNTHIFVGNAANMAADVAMSGDATMANTGALTIANGAINNAKVNAAAAIDYSKLAALTSGNILVGSAGNVATSVAISGDATIVASGALTIAAGAITNAKVNAAAAIDYSKLAALTSGNILVGSAGNVATSVAMSGDATIVASGALTIANNAITTVKILDANVTTAKIANNAVTTAQLDPTTVQYVKVPMTAAQWNAMYGAPFLLVAAPSAGKMIVVRNAVLAMTFVAAQYANGGAVALQYDSTAHGAGPLASATVAAATVNGYAASSDVGVLGADTSGVSSAKVQKGLYISNDTGAFDTGDGTWEVHVWYSVVTL